MPLPNVIRSSDFLLLHGNGVNDPARIGEMIRQARIVDGYRPMPILFNEEDNEQTGKKANEARVLSLIMGRAGVWKVVRETDLSPRFTLPASCTATSRRATSFVRPAAGSS